VRQVNGVGVAVGGIAVGVDVSVCGRGVKVGVGETSLEVEQAESPRRSGIIIGSSTA
jgi:hypothetical protein